MVKKQVTKLALIFCLFSKKQFFCGHEKKNYSYKEKPAFFSRGDYDHGKYIQFSVDQNGGMLGLGLGVSIRTLVALSQCGTKFENYKSSVLRPGIVKSLLFWGPTVFGYKYALAIKRSDFSVERGGTFLDPADPIAK